MSAKPRQPHRTSCFARDFQISVSKHAFSFPGKIKPSFGLRPFSLHNFPSRWCQGVRYNTS